MARGGITPFPLDLPRPSTANTDDDQVVSPSSIFRPTSFSLPQPVQRLLDFGSSRHQDCDGEMVPTRSKSLASPNTPAEQVPLLTIKLSGPSFLDTVIRDTVTKDALYIIETARDLTHIYRLDASRREAGKAATIQWPQTVSQSSKGKGRSGKSIQMSNGSWRDAEDLLKVGPLGNLASRKFSLPHYPHTLKWKLIPGDCYVCGTSGFKGPVAVLDAATLSAPPRLRIYQTLTSSDLARSQHNHGGVPFLLLDYLVVTSLLLTTTTQEWLDRPADAHLPGSSSRAVKRWLAIIHPERADEFIVSQPEQEKARPKEGDSPGEIVGPGSSVDGSTPVTPTSSRGARVWEAHMSWSSGSGSGGSETIFSPTGTSHSSGSAHNLPPRYSGSHVIGMHGFNGSQTQFAYGVEMSGSYQEQSSMQMPQRRLQVTNPEPTVESQYDGAPESRPQSAATTVNKTQHNPPSFTLPYTSDLDLRPSTASSLSSLNVIPTIADPTANSSVRRPPRQLPIPPVLQDPYTSQQQRQQATLGVPQMPPLHRVSSTPPMPAPSNPSTGSSSGPFTPSHLNARSLARRSLGGRPIPPPPPPPSSTLPLPLPPKLVAEFVNTPGSSSSRQNQLSTADHALSSQMRAMAISPPSQPYFPPSSYPPSDAGAHIDAGRVRASFTRVSQEAETESVYEMPPPAYDAIDFSLRMPGHAQRRAQ